MSIDFIYPVRRYQIICHSNIPNYYSSKSSSYKLTFCYTELKLLKDEN